VLRIVDFNEKGEVVNITLYSRRILRECYMFNHPKSKTASLNVECETMKAIITVELVTEAAEKDDRQIAEDIRRELEDASPIPWAKTVEKVQIVTAEM